MKRCRKFRIFERSDGWARDRQGTSRRSLRYRRFPAHGRHQGGVKQRNRSRETRTRKRTVLIPPTKKSVFTGHPKWCGEHLLTFRRKCRRAAEITLVSWNTVIHVILWKRYFIPQEEKKEFGKGSRSNLRSITER